jgi:hypothetical protein
VCISPARAALHACVPGACREGERGGGGVAGGWGLEAGGFWLLVAVAGGWLACWCVWAPRAWRGGIINAARLGLVGDAGRTQRVDGS